MEVIGTERLAKRYGPLKAVDGISLSVEEGQVFGFLGPNGSGKTTTIGMLLGIINRTAGRIRLFGSEDLHAGRRRVGATLEQPNFYPCLSGYDNLRVVAHIKGVAPDRIDRSLELVGLGGRRRSAFKTYSLGMKQRLAIAAATLGDPRLIILDEPANGLDPEGMREIRELVGRLAALGKTIFVSSHLLWEVERMCTHVAIIKRGRLLAQGGLADIVGAGTSVVLRGPDLDALEGAAAAYPAVGRVERVDDAVVAAIGDGDAAELNRWLVERGVAVSCLAPRRQSLEDVFMELTTEGDARLAEVAV